LEVRPVRFFISNVFAVLVLGIMAPRVRASEVLVFAAASLSEALRDIDSDYQKQSGDKIVLNLAASSTLARQIEEGVLADVFFSADEAKMDALEKKGLIVAETRRNRLSNSLVIVVPKEGGPAINAPRDLATDKVGRIALGDPKLVPAGVYAKEYLEKQGLWAAVKGKVIPTENVRGALAAVESGNVEAGIAYKTDAAVSKRVKVAYEVSAREGPQIHYPVAVIKGSRNLEAARKYLEYLGSDRASRVFERYGFVVEK
jgi:molybdate transport system substrate-binding protein